MRSTNVPEKFSCQKKKKYLKSFNSDEVLLGRNEELKIKKNHKHKNCQLKLKAHDCKESKDGNYILLFINKDFEQLLIIQEQQKVLLKVTTCPNENYSCGP